MPSAAPTSVISVALVEDNAGIRRAFQRLINETPGFSCICVCDCGEDAIREIPENPPDVVLMDLHLPNMSGVECTARLKEIIPAIHVIIVTVYDDTETVFKALRAGASGYLLKRADPEKILEAITDVSKGGAPMTSEIARKVIETFQAPAPPTTDDLNLTRREQEILEQLTKGFSNKEIGDRLNVSFDTVRWHLKQIYGKLHVRSRTEAANKFLRVRGPSTPRTKKG